MSRIAGAIVGGILAAGIVAFFTVMGIGRNPLLEHSGETLIAFTISACVVVVVGAWLGSVFIRPSQ